MLEQQAPVVLTEKAKEIIEEAVKKTDSNNRYDICETVGEILQERYIDTKRERIMQSMHLSTTKETLERIDAYMMKKIMKKMKDGELQ